MLTCIKIIDLLIIIILLTSILLLCGYTIYIVPGQKGIGK
ncbi:hypothetical protein UVUMRFZT_CDS0066 [Staphylococcus phage LJLAME001]